MPVPLMATARLQTGRSTTSRPGGCGIARREGDAAIFHRRAPNHQSQRLFFRPITRVITAPLITGRDVGTVRDVVQRRRHASHVECGAKSAVKVELNRAELGSVACECCRVKIVNDCCG